MNTPFATALRSLPWPGVFAAIITAWCVLYVMAEDMDLDLIGRPGPTAERMRAMDPGMAMDMPMARFGPPLAMWAVMMAAMMLPTMVPSLRAYEDLMRPANGSRAGWVGLPSGYLVVWTGFAALITGAQLALLFGGATGGLGIARSALVSGGLPIVVGAFQFTRAKEICHGICYSPTGYFLGRWRKGAPGGVRMGGGGLGAWCVGCCWGFMVLGFVGGVRSLSWMGLATPFMVLEKLPAIGHRVTRPMGAMLIAGGSRSSSGR